MPTIDISLTSELAEFVEHEVRSGRYSSASEVVRQGLTLLESERELQAARHALLKAAVQAGIDQAEQGIFSSRTIADIAEEVRTERQR
jgi:antitoxin ParD1/3/4